MPLPRSEHPAAALLQNALSDGPIRLAQFAENLDGHLGVLLSERTPGADGAEIDALSLAFPGLEDRQAIATFIKSMAALAAEAGGRTAQLPHVAAVLAQAPAADAPAADAPAADAPASDAPASDAPASDVPSPAAPASAATASAATKRGKKAAE